MTLAPTALIVKTTNPVTGRFQTVARHTAPECSDYAALESFAVTCLPDTGAAWVCDSHGATIANRDHDGNLYGNGGRLVAPAVYVAAWYLGGVLMTLPATTDFNTAHDSYCENPHNLTPEQMYQCSFRGVFTWAEIEDNLRTVADAEKAKAEAEAETPEQVAESFAAPMPVIKLRGIDDAPEIPGLAEAAAQPADSIRSIDMTPTWSGLMPALIAVLQNGTAEGHAMARAELMTLAQKTDHANATDSKLRALLVEVASLEPDSNDDFGDVIIDGTTTLFQRIKAAAKSLSAAANPDATQNPSRAERRAAMLARATARASGGFPLWACAEDDSRAAIAESMELYSDQLDPFDSVRDYVEYPEARGVIAYQHPGGRWVMTGAA